MIQEKLESYLSTLGDTEKEALAKTIKIVEEAGATESDFADELIKIASDEMNVDVITMSCIIVYAYLSKEKIAELTESGNLGKEEADILSGVLKIPEFNDEKLNIKKLLQKISQLRMII